MAAPAIIRNIADSFVRQSTPTKNYGSVSRMYVGTGFLSYLYWGNPIPRNAKVITAKLHFYSASVWSGSITSTVQRVNGPWSANRVTWNNDPGVTGATASQAKTGAGIGTHWIIDITSIMQTVANGGAWYGVRLTATGATQKSLFSMQAAASRRPWVEIQWSDNPFPPNNLIPRAGSTISTAKPTLTWNFVDYSGNREMSSFQVQVGTSAAMTSILHDSGVILGSVPEYDLNAHSNQVVNSGFETDASNWVSSLNCAISRSTSQAHSGTASLQLSSSAAGDMKAKTTNLISVSPGDIITATGFTRAAASARSTRLELVWIDVNAAILSTTAGSNVTNSTANYTTSPTVTGTAPAGAVQVALQVVVVGTAGASEIHYFDDLTLSVPPLFTTVFTPGTLYYWRVQTTDGAGLGSGWSTVESFIYQAPGVVTITNPTGGSPYVEEPTPVIGWTFTATQTAYQVILYSPTDDSRILWDSKKITSSNAYATIPSGKITVPGATYRVVVRVWDNQNRMSVPSYPDYVEQEKYFVYQFNAAVTAVSSITVTMDTLGISANVEVVRGTSPDSFVLLRDGVVVQTNIQPIDVQVIGNPTHYIISDYPAGRRNVVWTVICVVNGQSSQSNPTANLTVRRKFSWVTDPLNTSQVCLANPDHDLEDGELSAILQAIGGEPALITQSLFGESGSFSARLADNLVTGLTARQMKNNLRSIREDFNGRARLYFSDEAMEIYLHNLKVKRLNFSDGSTQYDVSFDFFEVSN